MFKHRIKISADLHKRLSRVAEVAGYATVEEFIAHILETAAGKSDEAITEEVVKKRLQGLGYIE